MRHFTKQFTGIAITLVMSLMWLTSSANVVNTGKVFKYTPDFIPTQFTVNNQSVLFLDEEVEGEDGNSTGQYKFTFFDASFNEQSSFTTPAFKKVTAISYYSTVESHSNVQKVGSNDELKVDNVSEETFTDYCYERDFKLRQDNGNEICMTSYYSENYYYCNEFEYQYPTLIYVYRDGNIYERTIEYSSDKVYGEPRVRTESFFPNPKNIDLISSNCYETESFFQLTQTLFNNDAAFEWIVESYTTVDYFETDSSSYYGWKLEGQRIVANGFKVISQNGSTLADIAVPDSDGSTLDFCLYLTDAGSFLFVEYYVKKDEVNYDTYDDGCYYQVYKIDSETSSIEPVGAPRKVGVSPTTPHRGTPVNVSLGEPVDNGTKLTVVSVAGRTAFVQSLEPGSTEAVIDTNRLERGVYVVVVDDGKTKREATKIVVR